ncbi:MAG: spore maturation protein [Clostridiales bacterium]|jgi:spore maturation protein B|nr:spore maturation protein [Clostridiales bacterium]
MQGIMRISYYLVPGLFFLIALYAYIKKVPVYATFVEGATEGLKTAWRILPFLLGMLVVIGIFRASGALALFTGVLEPLFRFLGIPKDAIPLLLMRPLSGSGSLALVSDIITTHGPDSYIGRLAAIVQGSTETTFYLLAVYFGSVGVKRYRYALTLGLSADMVSFIAAAFFCRLFFS